MHISTPDAARRQRALELSVDWGRAVLSSNRNPTPINEDTVIAVAEQFDKFLKGDTKND